MDSGEGTTGTAAGLLEGLVRENVDMAVEVERYEEFLLDVQPEASVSTGERFAIESPSSATVASDDVSMLEPEGCLECLGAIGDGAGDVEGAKSFGLLDES